MTPSSVSDLGQLDTAADCLFAAALNEDTPEGHIGRRMIARGLANLEHVAMVARGLTAKG